MNTKQDASHIHGYSKRGVVNAVFETIAGHADANRLLEKLLGRTAMWSSGSRLPWKEGWVEDFEIYVGPSLSDFGDPDVLLLVKHRDLDLGWYAFFIEAKMEPFLMSSPPTAGDDKYKKNSSSLLHKLFLKYCFSTNYLVHGNDQNYLTALAEGISVYADETEPGSSSTQKKFRRRKIGQDPVVLWLVRRLRELAPTTFFVSLTTDPPPSPDETSSRDWPLGKAVTGMLKKICVLNDCAGVSHQWVELSYLLSWFDVTEWANENDLKRVKQALRENEEKFKFGRGGASPDRCWEKLEIKE
jgi:hypothetical protein